MYHPPDPVVNTMGLYHKQCTHDNDCSITTTCSCAMVGMRVCCNVHIVDDLEFFSEKARVVSNA